MKVNDHILLWEHATIKVLDVRHAVMNVGERLLGYRLPASAFLYATNGCGEVTLDGTVQVAKRFHVFHGGKGMCLDVTAQAYFEYYLILYKAKIPLYSSKKLLQLMECENPFQLQYGFIPHSPLSLFENVNLMDKEWKEGNTLKRFHVKALFYRLVYELLHQLYEQGIETTKPDLVSQGIHYIHERYNEPITLESIAEELNYTTQYFSKKFKLQTGQSPGTIVKHKCDASRSRGTCRVLGSVLFQSYF